MPFEKGHSHGKGRPKGARQKLSEKFLDDVMEHWKTNGTTALQLACASDPMKYIQMIADMLPKEATLNVNETLTLRSESVQALDEWLASVGRREPDSETKNALPH